MATLVLARSGVKDSCEGEELGSMEKVGGTTSSETIGIGCDGGPLQRI